MTTSSCDGCCHQKCAFIGSGPEHHAPDQHDKWTSPIPDQETAK